MRQWQCRRNRLARSVCHGGVWRGHVEHAGAGTKTPDRQGACRLLKPGGRYAIHELCLVPDDLNDAIKREINHALSHAIHVGARPLTRAEWRAVLEAEGFSVQVEELRPMR